MLNVDLEISPRPARIILRSRKGEQVIALDSTPVTGGRAPENTVVVLDPRVSRFHFRVELIDGRWRLTDVGSQNGTFSKGRRIRATTLEVGDVIQVGSSTLEYQELADDDTGGEMPIVSDFEDPAGQTQALSRISSEHAQRLRRLGDVAKALTREPSDEGVFRVLVDAAVELTGSERGFLMQAKKEGFEFASARNIAHEDLESPEFQVSWSIAIRVGTTGQGLLLVDASTDERFASRESVESLGLKSVLSLPIQGDAGIVGVIYVDNPLRYGAYTEEDRDLMELLADHAEVALRSRRLVSQLTDRQQEVEVLNHRLLLQVEERDSELKRIRQRDGSSAYDGFSVLVGSSARMNELRHLLQKVAATDFSILIQGESGTGKELVANCIHHNSARKNEAFVSINCAAIPETLLENELFGHARGAFTGADQSKKGLFQAAHKGTLFLDEASEMSPAMQSRFLRVLQEGEVRPVGAKDTISVNVRVVAASNRDLAAMVKEGAFREDLYYRLKVLPVVVPPLRSRRDDIPDLVTHFFRKHAGGRMPTLEADALDALSSYAWPGNVRELENEVKRLCVLAGSVITKSKLSPHVLDAGQMLVGRDSSFQDLNALVEAVETREIKKALDRTFGNKTKAATLLGISRFTLQRKLDKYDLDAGTE